MAFVKTVPLWLLLILTPQSLYSEGSAIVYDRHDGGDRVDGAPSLTNSVSVGVSTVQEPEVVSTEVLPDENGLILQDKDSHDELGDKIAHLKSVSKAYEQNCALMGEMQNLMISAISSNHNYGKDIRKLRHSLRRMHRELKKMKMQSVKKYTKPNFDNNLLPGAPGVLHEQRHLKHIIVKYERERERNITDIVEKTTDRMYKKLEDKIAGLSREMQKDKILIMSKDGLIKKLIAESKSKDTKIAEQADTIYELMERMDWVEKALIKMYRKRNAIESHKAINANKADCPHGFFRFAMSCYKFENMTANWPTAERHCQDRHAQAHLVSIETPEENDFIISYRKYNTARWSSPWLWAGGTDRAVEGAWKWVGTGKAFDYTYWMRGEPNGNKHQNCLYFTGGGNHTWDDWDCNSLYINFVCEIPLDEPL